MTYSVKSLAASICWLIPAMAGATIIQSNLIDTTSQSAFPCSAADLINGGPTVSNRVVTGVIDWPDPIALTNGVIGAVSSTGTNGVGSDKAWEVTFYLDTSANTNGYTITNIATFAGWAGGRISQNHELKLAFQGDPGAGTFYSIGNFSVAGGAPANGSTKIEVTDSTGTIASNVSAVRVSIPAGFGVIYREVDVLGIPSTTLAQGPSFASVYVSTNGGNNPPYASWDDAATNIHAAFGLATSARIFVSNGTYNITNEITISDGTVLSSINGYSNTIIRRATGNMRIFTLTASAAIDGFTLRDGNPGSSGGAVIMSAGTIRNCLFTSNSGVYGAIHMTGGVVSNCIFTRNTATADGGGIHMASPGGTVANCIFTNNTVGRWGGGFEFESTSAGNALIRNCLIARNYASSAGGGLSSYAANAVVQNCTIVSNYSPGSGGGVWQNTGGTLALTNTIVYYNSAPADADLSGTMSASYSCSPNWAVTRGGGTALITDDPMLIDFTNCDYRLQLGSPCVDTGTNLAAVANDLEYFPRPFDGDFDGLPVTDMGAFEMSSTSSLFSNFNAPVTAGTGSLQAVFTAVISGPAAETSITWYAWDFNNDGTNELAGTNRPVATNDYSEPGRYSVRLSVSNSLGNATNRLRNNYIKVYAPGNTAYVSTNGLDVWPYHTWAKAATNIQSAIDIAPNMLILVSNGTYNIVYSIFPVNGTTIRATGGYTNTILKKAGTATRILDINLYAGSGALNTNILIDGFTIRDGTSSGIYMYTGTVMNCYFMSNAGTYGAISMYGGTVSNCIFVRNSATADGGGIHLAGAGGLIANCIFTSNNVNRWGGGVEVESNSGRAFVRNCLVARNTAADSGGGISVYNAIAIVENCTITSNSAVNAGGGVWQSNGGTPRLTNCISYFNRSASGTNISGALTIGYSCAPELVDGLSNNIAANPLFVDFTNGDYRLTRESPCVDRGRALPWMTDGFDLDSHPRVQGPQPDMGAYELLPLPPGTHYLFF